MLTAEWTNLIVATYEVDKKLLEKFLPCNTELNDWNGKYLVSLVGFMFSNTTLMGIKAPLFKSFPEINLRFYVKWKNKKHMGAGSGFYKRNFSFCTNRISS